MFILYLLDFHIFKKKKNRTVAKFSLLLLYEIYILFTTTKIPKISFAQKLAALQYIVVYLLSCWLYLSRQAAQQRQSSPLSNERLFVLYSWFR